MLSFALLCVCNLLFLRVKSPVLQRHLGKICVKCMCIYTYTRISIYIYIHIRACSDISATCAVHVAQREGSSWNMPLCRASVTCYLFHWRGLSLSICNIYIYMYIIYLYVPRYMEHASLQGLSLLAWLSISCVLLLSLSLSMYMYTHTIVYIYIYICVCNTCKCVVVCVVDDMPFCKAFAVRCGSFYMCVYMYVYTYIYVCIYIYIYVSLAIYIYAMCVYMYTYIYIYIYISTQLFVLYYS